MIPNILKLVLDWMEGVSTHAYTRFWNPKSTNNNLKYSQLYFLIDYNIYFGSNYHKQ